jgi:hypothetical protein
MMMMVMRIEQAKKRRILKAQKKIRKEKRETSLDDLGFLDVPGM